MHLEEMLAERRLPEVLRLKNGEKVLTKEDFEKSKTEIKELLSDNIYGKIPEAPTSMTVTQTSENTWYLGKKATIRDLCFSFDIHGEKFEFPVISVVPNNVTRPPVLLYISFDKEFPGRRGHIPIEEIIDSGFAIFSFAYSNVTSDDGNFEDGIAKIFLKGDKRAPDAPGKIAMWAWAAMRVMDYIVTLDYVDTENVAVIGHSRLGKTALLTGAFDERFKFVISNNSGCSGAAITRGKIGENINNITNIFPYWFCEKYKEYRDTGIEDMPFDQHFLTALVPPRHLVIGSATLDEWADPKSEFLNAVITNDIYKLYGMRGLVHEDKIPTAPTELSEGEASYHVRLGEHFLSRVDWNAYMRFIKKKI